MSDEANSESEAQPEAASEGEPKGASEAQPETPSEGEPKGASEEDEATPKKDGADEVVGTVVEQAAPEAPAKAKEVAETRASVLDMARGEVNAEDLGGLEAAINALDFATRKATADMIDRLEALHARLGNLVAQIRKGERTPEAEREALSEEALQIVQSLVDQGVSAGERGNLEEARGYLEEAIQLNPDGIDCLFNLGVVYGLLAHHNIAKAEFYDNYVRDEVFIDRAKICYDHLLEIEPDHMPSLNNLATLYSIRGSREEAIRLLGRIVALKPKGEDEEGLVARARAQLDELDSI